MLAERRKCQGLDWRPSFVVVVERSDVAGHRAAAAAVADRYLGAGHIAVERVAVPDRIVQTLESAGLAASAELQQLASVI